MLQLAKGNQGSLCRLSFGGPRQEWYGPSLHDVVGRTAGTFPNYQYSATNKNSGLTLDDAMPDRYLKSSVAGRARNEDDLCRTEERHPTGGPDRLPENAQVGQAIQSGRPRNEAGHGKDSCRKRPALCKPSYQSGSVAVGSYIGAIEWTIVSWSVLPHTAVTGCRRRSQTRRERHKRARRLARPRLSRWSSRRVRLIGVNTSRAVAITSASRSTRRNPGSRE